jgi:arylsulfatase A
MDRDASILLGLRQTMKLFGVKPASALLVLLAVGTPAAPAPAPERPPNVVLIVADDLGWGDLAAYGHPTIRTPRLDRMAAEGQRWTSFYAAAPYCTPSRAGLLTGRLPIRSGMASESYTVLYPDSTGGLPDGEVTLAELLRARGYATAMVGKWHLGHRPEYLPRRHGFDLYFGIPYSNDMDARADAPADRLQHPRCAYFDVPVIRDEQVVERPADQSTITRRYEEEARRFVRANRDRPFFLYLAHTMPHVPLFAGAPFAGRSPRGPYGDVVEEIDAGVGRLLDTLAELGLDRRTLVVFSSDNGPWRGQGGLGGSAGPFRDGKGTTFEGGVRVPGIFRWPGTIRPGVVREMGSLLDVLPTVAALAKAPLPADRVLDGYDLSPVLRGQGRSPRRTYFYYRNAVLQAVRSGPYKLHFFTRPDGNHERPQPVDPPWLFDLDRDPGELYDVAAEHPDVVADLRRLADEHRRTVVLVEDQIAKR